MQWVGVTACAACAAVYAETWLEDATEDAAGEDDDAGFGTLELHVVVMVMVMMRQWRIAAAALYATYMYYNNDIVGQDT